MMMTACNVLVVGGGPAGLTAAIGLAKRGVTNIVVVERQEEGSDASAGTSMGLEANGLLSLRNIDKPSYKKVRAASIVVNVLQLLSSDGMASQRITLKETEGELPRQITRSTLQAILSARAAELGVHVMYGWSVASVTNRHDTVLVNTERGKSEKRVFESQAVLVADGHFSPCRSALLEDGHPSYAGFVCWRIKSMSGKHRGVVQPNEKLMILSRGEQGGMLRRTSDGGIAVDVVKRVNDWGMWPCKRDRTASQAKQAMLEAASEWPLEIQDLLEDVEAEDVIERGVFHRPYGKVWGRGRCTVLGDAAHPTIPNTDQNWSQAMRDIEVLTQHFDLERVDASLRGYERNRVPEYLLHQQHTNYLGWVYWRWEEGYASYSAKINEARTSAEVTQLPPAPLSKL